MLTFPNLVDAYLTYLQDRSSSRRVRAVVQQWIGQLTEMPTRQAILARHQRRAENGVPTTGHYRPGAQSANKELSVLRSLIRWGIYEGQWRSINPTDGIRKWKTPRRRRVLNYQEMSRVLHALDFAQSACELRDRAFFGLLLFSGCRPLEACRARAEEITTYSSMGRWIKPITKNGHAHEIPLPRQMMEWLRAYHAGTSGFLFPGADGGPITPRAMQKRWSKWRSELRFEGLYDGFWLYDFRRTLATYLITVLKEDSVTVQAILNHYDGRAIGHYSHHTFDTLTPIVQHYADWLCSHREASYDTSHLVCGIQPVADSRLGGAAAAHG